MSDENISPNSIIILSIGLAGDIYMMYKAYETRAVSVFVNDIKIGPYAQDADPLIFWTVIGLQVIIALGIIFYLYRSIEPSSETPHIPDEEPPS